MKCRFTIVLMPLLLGSTLGCSSGEPDTARSSSSAPPPPSGSHSISEANYGAMRDLVLQTQKANRAARKREQSGLASTCNRAKPCTDNLAGITTAVTATHYRFENCLKAWGQLNPSAPPNLPLEITLRQTGQIPPRSQISQIRILEKGLGNPFLRGCLLAGLGELYFSAPRQPTKLIKTVIGVPSLHQKHSDHH